MLLYVTSVMQCVAVCCSVLQCVAVCCMSWRINIETCPSRQFRCSTIADIYNVVKMINKTAVRPFSDRSTCDCTWRDAFDVTICDMQLTATPCDMTHTHSRTATWRIRWYFMWHATHCNTLQITATHCNTLQHTAAHCNTLQHTVTWRIRSYYMWWYVTWLLAYMWHGSCDVLTCDTTLDYMWHASSISLWCFYMRCDSSLHATWRFHVITCDMALECMWHGSWDAIICDTILDYMWHSAFITLWWCCYMGHVSGLSSKW